MASEVGGGGALLPCRKVIYCGACGIPPEYCEFGPDFETDCDPWLKKNYPKLRLKLLSERGAVCKQASKKGGGDKKQKEKKEMPEKPWTTEERLRAFYEKYVPEKVETVPSLLEKYAGKEDKLFQALVKKYGDEPNDPYYGSDSDDDDDDDDECDSDDGGDAPLAASAKDKKKRRGVGAKKGGGGDGSSGAGAPRVVVQKVAQKKRRCLTVVSGMETVPGTKLKDVSKSFAKRFAGSSSVKDNAAKGTKEIIIQGDHVYDVAEMIVDKFHVPECSVFLDIDGEVVPLR